LILTEFSIQKKINISIDNKTIYSMKRIINIEDLTIFVIVSSFQIRLELSHLVDWRGDFYWINFIWYNDHRIISSIEDNGKEFTDIVIVLDFQVRLELSHLVDSYEDLYWINLIYDHRTINWIKK